MLMLESAVSQELKKKIYLALRNFASFELIKSQTKLRAALEKKVN